MTADLFADHPDGTSREPLDEGGTWLLDVVAAVDHLRRGYRPGLTVWDALAEALHWAAGSDDQWRHAPDALADALRGLDTATPVAEHLQGAVRGWVTAMANRYNGGHHWPHPIHRRLFPPPILDLDTGTFI